MPIWKSLLKNSFPMILITLVFGIYTLVDSILAVNLAADSYKNNATAQIIGLKNYVRLSITASNPIVFLIFAISLFFTTGISTRVAINLGQKRIERAKNTIRTGFQIQIIVCVVLVLTLLFVVIPWIESQYPRSKFGTVVDDAYKYVVIIIAAIPLIFFNQTMSSLFRVDVRLNEMMVATIAPIFINLFFDWILMGPAGMGVEGGAWATFISHSATSVLFVVFAMKNKTQLIKFKNFFGKFKIISIFGIFLIGISPFLGNFAPSIIQTANFAVIKNVSSHVFKEKQTEEISQIIESYKIGASPNEAFKLINGAWSELTGQKIIDYDSVNTNVVNGLSMNLSQLAPVKPIADVPVEDYSNVIWKTIITKNLVARTSGSFMSIATSGAFPIFALFFFIIFGFMHGGIPLVSYNYGAKNFDKVKQAFKYSLLYSFILGVILYVIGGVVLSNLLLDVLGVSSKYKPYARTIILIQMVSLPVFSIGISGILILNSIDRIIASIIASGSRALIFFFPILYLFEWIAISQINPWWLFWWSSPLVNFFSSMLILGMTLFTIKKIHVSHKTLDDRIQLVYAKFDKKTKK